MLYNVNEEVEMSVSKREIAKTAFHLSKYYNEMMDLGNSGIEIYSKWKEDFYTFYSWSIRNGYTIGKKLTRKVKEIGFIPINCKFVDEDTKINIKNSRRRSDNIIIFYKGETKTATEWSEILGIPRTTMYYRSQMGWSDEEIIEGKSKSRR